MENTSIEEKKNNRGKQRLGGFSHWHGIRICACLLGCYFAKIDIVTVGFHQRWRSPNFINWGVFWANYGKSPNLSKIGCFLSKMVYWWVGNCAKKNWYREIQIFEVRHAGTPMYNFGKSTPSRAKIKAEQRLRENLEGKLNQRMHHHHHHFTQKMEHTSIERKRREATEESRDHRD